MHRTYYVAPDFEIRDGIAITYVRVGGNRVAKIESDALAAQLLPDAAPQDGLITASDAYQAISSGAAADEVDLLLSAAVRRTVQDGVTFLHHNHQGTSAATTDARGELLQRTEHYPYGEVRYQSGSLEDYSWTGQERDQSIGLSYHSARYLDTRSGRWTAPDPLFLASPEKCLESPGECNLYSYAANDPASSADPSGLCLQGCDPHAMLAYARDKLRTGAEMAAHAAVEVTQTTLDVVGIVDPTGVADAENAAIYVARGKYADASISGVGVFPIIGDVAKGPRIATKVSKVLSLLGASEKTIARIRKLGSRLNKIISAKLGQARSRSPNLGSQAPPGQTR